MQAAREQLGEAAFAAAWDEGARLTLGQALALALQPEAEGKGPPTAEPPVSNSLRDHRNH
jgi:hypothetical protein